ncbi:MAG: hypothetical protein ACLQQ4_17095 [Bacteroidia bacterium]
MIWHDIKQIAGIFTLSTVKFGFGGIPLAVFAHFPFFKGVTITTAGGVTGSIVFANVSELVLATWVKFRMKYLPYRKPKNKTILDSKFAHKVKDKWGLAGIAFFTPLFLSIPIGTMLAVRFYQDKQRVISYMLISIAAWDIVLYFLYNHFYSFISHYFHFAA